MHEVSDDAVVMLFMCFLASVCVVLLIALEKLGKWIAGKL